MATLYVYRGAPTFLEGVKGRLDSAGYTLTDEPAAASVAITFCTSQTQLEEVYFGDDGLVQVMESGSLLVDISAATPNFARDLNSIATVSDLYMVEAPLVVADMAVEYAFEKDNLMCFVAGEDEAVKRAQRLLKVLFGTVMSIGRPGTAQLARCARTMQNAAQAISAIEAEALYKAHRHAVGGSGLGKLNVEATSIVGNSMLAAAREGQFNGGYTVEMLMAELSSALMAADDVELILPQTEAAMHLLELLAVIGGSDMTPAGLSLVYAEESEVSANGLDWSRAEQTYGGHSAEGSDEDFDLDGVFGHLHGFNEDLSQDDDYLDSSENDSWSDFDYDPDTDRDYDDDDYRF